MSRRPAQNEAPTQAFVPSYMTQVQRTAPVSAAPVYEETMIPLSRALAAVDAALEFASHVQNRECMRQKRVGEIGALYDHGFDDHDDLMMMMSMHDDVQNEAYNDADHLAANVAAALGMSVDDIGAKKKSWLRRKAEMLAQGAADLAKRGANYAANSRAAKYVSNKLNKKKDSGSEDESSSDAEKE